MIAFATAVVLRSFNMHNLDPAPSPPPAPLSRSLVMFACRCWIRAETLPAEKQASLTQASGKGVVNGSKDDGVAELTAALNAISVAVGTAAEGGPAQDVKLCEVLAHLDIVPGRPAHPAAIEAVQAWAELEDQLEIVEALTKDATDVLNERVNGTFADDANLSDNELELAGTENVESEGGRRLAPPPPFSELSSLFGPLEKYAESCGISGAAYYLRKAKMDFIHARSSKPAVQADIRAMFSDS